MPTATLERRVVRSGCPPSEDHAMPHTTLVALLAGLACAGGACAAPVFSDDFDGNALGLNAVPAGWTVGGGGAVDVIGGAASGSLFDLLPGHGAYIDLDGSTTLAGALSLALELTAGVTYEARFDLAGTQRGLGTIGVVSFGSALLPYSLASDAAFTTMTLRFTPDASGSASLVFQNESAGKKGALLDNVVVSVIPEPGTGALLLAGLALLVGIVRRQGRGDRD
jgi:hypothetical protein